MERRSVFHMLDMFIWRGDVANVHCVGLVPAMKRDCGFHFGAAYLKCSLRENLLRKVSWMNEMNESAVI